MRRDVDAQRERAQERGLLQIDGLLALPKYGTGSDGRGAGHDVRREGKVKTV